MDTNTATQIQTIPRFIVMTAAACMPGSCWGRYGKIAVVELEPGTIERPKMISAHARGIVKVVALWDRCHWGGRYSAAGVAQAAAQDLCDDLNGAWGSEAQASAADCYGVKL
jgi:hypothetical protein